ncbi:unnamed protein product [Pleuronectes platessa]|uniref:Uncharacterized protein n=1 Tax=Pleuronectes platessa TaxID=8262 RepID=A0A9N7UGR5_PLEPL|nr:unnamed protein product [Pleuronectes platessa]
MEKMVKPLIPPHMSVYADKHGVFHLLQVKNLELTSPSCELGVSVLTEQPDDPVSYLISVLQRSSLNIPRIMVLGPPAVGNTLSPVSLRPPSYKAPAALNGQLLDSVVMVNHFQRCVGEASKLSAELRAVHRDPDEFIEGPIRAEHHRHAQAGFWRESLRPSSGSDSSTGRVVPEHVVILEASDDVLLERREGKLANDIIAQRLEQGRGHSEAQH